MMPIKSLKTPMFCCYEFLARAGTRWWRPLSGVDSWANAPFILNPAQIVVVTNNCKHVKTVITFIYLLVIFNIIFSFQLNQSSNMHSPWNHIWIKQDVYGNLLHRQNQKASSLGSERIANHSLSVMCTTHVCLNFHLQSSGFLLYGSHIIWHIKKANVKYCLVFFVYNCYGDLHPKAMKLM